MTKIKALYEKHYYSVFFFLFILVYSCIVPGGLQAWETTSVTQSFHAVDFSMGFCSRILPGAIYDFLFGAVNEQVLNIYLAVLMIVFFLVLSLFLERFILGVDSEYRFVATVFVLFFITGPATFSIYIKLPGMMDTYWLFAGLLFFVLLSKKQTWFLLFVPFLICALVHHATWLCYIPSFVLIALYKISVTQKKREKAYLWVALSLTVAAAVALTVYLVFFERDNLVYTVEEFIDVLSAKGSNHYTYFAESFYYYGYAPPESTSIFEELLFRISTNFISFNSLSRISVVVLLLPIVIFIYKFFIKQIATDSNKLKKFSYACMLLLVPCSVVATSFLSTDLIRWVGHAFLPLFASFLYVLYNEGAEAWNCVREDFQKINIKTVLIYLVFYMSVVYYPYIV
ncbi:MAG: hypothetical protein IKY78_04380 [Clostridia bacterium]|nr:hypothetical protein [Clostridia bacterium]